MGQGPGAPLPFTPHPPLPSLARAHLVCESLSFQLLEFASCCFLCRVQAKNGGWGTVRGQSEGQSRGDRGRDVEQRGDWSDQPVTSGLGCDFYPREEWGHGLLNPGGGRDGHGDLSGLQTAHLPLNPIPAPSTTAPPAAPARLGQPGEEDRSPAC